ncbi:hypothetical protein [Natroniella sp. ANB-PHB2]|uniref:hypothetical protein n=1 Tax=Natroniella sp. ANB-PHB2 TaxID=3384444 RepID=UPI0038D41063
MLSCTDIIQKRRELWANNQDIGLDREFRKAIVDKLTEVGPEGELTEEAQKLKDEIQTDPSLLVEMVFVIDNKEGERVPFFPNQAQSMVKKEYRRCKKEGISFRAIIIKGRQQGISSYVTSLQLAQGITTKNFQGYTVADEDKSTNNLFEKAKSYYEPLPEKLKPTEKYNNRKEFRWAKDDGQGMNSSWGISTAGNTSKDGRVGNSFTIHFLHVSELAWWPIIDKTMSGLTDACTPSADIILETTANGYNEAQERWDKAVKGKSDYIAIFIPWYIQKEYSKEFRSEEEKREFIKDIDNSNYKIFKNLRNYRANIEEITYEKLWWYYRKYVDDKNEDLAEMQQEYPTFPEEAFQASGNPVFNIDKVKEKLLYAKKKIGPLKAFNAIPIVRNTDSIKERVKFDHRPVAITGDERWPEAEIYVFEEYDPNKTYVCAADVAEGDGGDYSSASIYSIDDWKQAVQINGHWEADEYGYLLYEWGQNYGWAYMMVENNNHGLTTNTTLLKELNYPEHSFHFRYKDDEKRDEETRKMGWWTGNNKFLMIDEFRTAAINSDQMEIKDYKTLQECMTYVKDKNGGYNAESGSFDDRIIDKAIAWQGRKYVKTKSSVVWSS